MKKLKSTIPDGGAPLGAFPVLRELFDEETKNAIEALLYSVADGETEGFVLKGCEVTGISSDYDIAEGYIYVDGEVLYYAGSEGNSTPVYLKKDTVTEESGVFADGASKAYIDVNTATEYTTTGGGAGTQYITFNFDTAGRTFKNMTGVGNAGNGGSYTSFKISTVQIGDWDMNSDSTTTVDYPDGVSKENLRGLSGIIIPDVSASIQNNYMIGGFSAEIAATSPDVNFANVGASGIIIRRVSSGFYDSTDFEDTPFNRGWVTVLYED